MYSVNGVAMCGCIYDESVEYGAAAWWNPCIGKYGGTLVYVWIIWYM